MAKLPRKTLLQFGSTVNAGSEIGQYGSYASPIYSSDITVLQAGTAWPRGWAAETIATNRPFLEDMNAVDFVFGYMLSYILQQGIAEYDSGTTYYIGSMCAVAGVPYVSLTDTNTGNTPSSSPSNWKISFAQTKGANVASTPTLTLGNDGNSFVITGTTNVTDITIKPAGAIIQLLYGGLLTIIKGGNLRISEDFVSQENSTITLISDGTYWYELSRSPIIVPSIVGLGDPVGITPGTIYLAATDGFLVGNSYDPTPQGNGFLIYTNSNSNPAVGAIGQRGQSLWVSGAPIQRLPFNCPVKKGNYYVVYGLDLNGSVNNSRIEQCNFIPLGV